MRLAAPLPCSTLTSTTLNLLEPIGEEACCDISRKRAPGGVPDGANVNGASFQQHAQEVEVADMGGEVR